MIGIATDYFTDDSKKPGAFVAKASRSAGVYDPLRYFLRLLSVLPAMIGSVFPLWQRIKLCEPINPAYATEYALFGISMAAVGMLSIVGMIVSNDAYGPIVDNARGLAEMGELGDDVLEITTSLTPPEIRLRRSQRVLPFLRQG